ncbi:hypothetical protein L1987_09935 [Smallanthus sonchifolius]|uniref:Uncharacterized protein n=1 Tax=Smallanthus sonchifolius TaxID=185202 RepID=A0ACB9JQP2_9ASTR|nr:hypothetical protein L1987_09935 [Smallanthus sonchifolius]
MSLPIIGTTLDWRERRREGRNDVGLKLSIGGKKAGTTPETQEAFNRQREGRNDAGEHASGSRLPTRSKLQVSDDEEDGVHDLCSASAGAWKH